MQFDAIDEAAVVADRELVGAVERDDSPVALLITRRVLPRGIRGNVLSRRHERFHRHEGCCRDHRDPR